jgi:hypothetical protein
MLQGTGPERLHASDLGDSHIQLTYTRFKAPRFEAVGVTSALFSALISISIKVTFPFNEHGSIEQSGKNISYSIKAFLNYRLQYCVQCVKLLLVGHLLSFLFVLNF